MTSTGSNFQYMWPHAYATLLLMSAFDSINMKEFVKRSCAITLHALSEGVRGIQESSFFNDPNLREGFGAHTEEIVAGERMAVKYVIRQHSFEAPC